MSTDRPSVLIVEDDPEQANRIGLVLGKAGYAVDHAPNGQEALPKVRSNPPDLIILDAVMPRMSGFQLARLIKFEPNLKRIAVLMLTVLDRPADKEKSKEVGADLFLTKPFKDEELLTSIEKLLKLGTR